MLKTVSRLLQSISSKRLFLYCKHIQALFTARIISHFVPLSSIDKTTIYFPPSLGVGDTIFLSQLVDIARLYLPLSALQVASATPWVTQKFEDIKYISTDDYKSLAQTRYIILAAYSPLNYIAIYLLRGVIPPPFRLPGKANSSDILQPYYKRIGHCLKIYRGQDFKPKVWTALECNAFKAENGFCKNTDLLNSSVTTIGMATFTGPHERRLPLSQVLTVYDCLKSIFNEFQLVLFGSANPDEFAYYGNICRIVNSCRSTSSPTLINLCGKTPTMDTLIANILSVNYFLACDSGIGNIVQMLNIPSVIIYGSVYPPSRVFSPNVLTLSGQKHCPYFPCHTDTHYTCKYSARFNCMFVEPDVLKAALSKLKLEAT